MLFIFLIGLILEKKGMKRMSGVYVCRDAPWHVSTKVRNGFAIIVSAGRAK